MRAALAALWIAASAVWSLRDWLRRAEDYLGPDAATLDWVVSAVRLALAVGTVAAAAALFARRASLRIDGAAMRSLLYCLLWALAAGTLAAALSPPEAARWPARNGFFIGLHVATLVWVGHRRRRASDRPAASPTRTLDWLTMNLLVTLVVLEVALVAWVRIHPTPLVAPRSVEAWLDAMRRPPHALHHGEPLNSGGYADDEFFVAEDGDFVAVFLADSFGLATVPRSYNFVHVAEIRAQEVMAKQYRRIAFHDFGVPAIGPAEYARLYVDEAAATSPSLVVLNVFLGNDVQEGHAFVASGSGAERYGLQGWLVSSALWHATRLLRVSHAERAAVTAVAASTASALPPHLENASLERPTFTEERFLEIESERVELANPRSVDAEQFPDFLRSLDWFADRLGDRLLVVLIPDEYHVNDALYAELMAGKATPEAYERFSPQARVLAHCETRGIECLDLTPALRAAEAGGRTYHLRDTHWNARGNRVAGEAIAEAILERMRGDASR